jgi:hypothetical protein
MVHFTAQNATETKLVDYLLKAFNQRLHFKVQVNRESVPEYNDTHEKFFFQKIKRCLESFHCTFDQTLTESSDFEKIFSKPHKMLFWSFDCAELSSLLKTFTQVFDQS